MFANFVLLLQFFCAIYSFFAKNTKLERKQRKERSFLFLEKREAKLCFEMPPFLLFGQFFLSAFNFKLYQKGSVCYACVQLDFSSIFILSDTKSINICGVMKGPDFLSFR